MDQTIDTRRERRSMRTAANNAILHLHPARVPSSSLRYTYTWGLGGIATVLAALLAGTGLLLMFRYDADVNRAYTSIQTLEAQIAFGSLVRAIHHWSANLLVIVSFLHLLRVFFTGGYKRGRFANWVIGLGLFIIVLAFNFTGYLLPWDQLAYWAVTVSTSLLGYLPSVGDTIMRFILAGPEVGQTALRNFYAVHVAVLPFLLAAMMSYHFWKIRKNGGISHPVNRDGRPVRRQTSIPHLVRREYAMAAIVIAGVLVFSMSTPAPLGEMANARSSPNPAKAAWYFLGLQELLLHMHALAALVLIGTILLGLIFLPGWDRKESDIGIYFRSKIGRRAALVGAFLAADLIPVLVMVDEYWLDFSRLLPDWPPVLSLGLVPLLLSYLGIILIYLGFRWLLRAHHSEAVLGLFTFFLIGYVVLTLIGIYFRGPNMALVLPF